MFTPKLSQIRTLTHEGNTNVMRFFFFIYTASEVLDTNEGMKFTTWDADNDILTDRNCASIDGGGWWYRYCTLTATTAIPEEYRWMNEGYDIYLLHQSYIMVRRTKP